MLSNSPLSLSSSSFVGPRKGDLAGPRSRPASDMKAFSDATLLPKRSPVN